MQILYSYERQHSGIIIGNILLYTEKTIQICYHSSASVSKSFQRLFQKRLSSARSEPQASRTPREKY